jgi:hypothetical protein
VGNNTEIIEHHLMANHSAFQSPVIDTGIGLHFDIISYPYPTRLMDFLPALLTWRKTKTVATNHHTSGND